MSRGTVLVTGASGMVGRWVAKRLIDEGYDVSVMVRPSSDRSALEGLNAKFVEADLSKPETLPAAVEGMEYVVHAAAHIGDWGKAELYRKINVVGLEHLLTAVRQNPDFKRWIQISSLGIYPARDHFGTDETADANPEGLDGYTRTKAEAEVLLNRYISEYQFPAVILRPGFIYGPGERNFFPRLVENIRAGKMKMIGDGQKFLNNTCVHNLVDATVLAMEAPEVLGETFNIRDERLVTREEFVSAFTKEMGKPYPPKVPEAIARMLVVVLEGGAKLVGAKKPPLVTKARFKFMAVNLDFSIDKAKRVLGWQPRVDFTEGIREALDWARDAGMIKPDEKASAES
ncbi:MAG: NAD-dependent epimerase/dehydratase family protein [Planctomycetota bacterium]